MVKPSQRREMAKEAVNHCKISVRIACQIFVVSETCYRYQPKLSDEHELIADKLIDLTEDNKTGDLACAFCTCVM